MSATVSTHATVTAGLSRRTLEPRNPFRAAQPGRCLRPGIARQNKRAARPAIVAQGARHAACVRAAKVGNSYSKVFGTEEAQADLRFAELLDGTNKILVVCAVAPGSKAEKEGVKVGQQVLAVSDPGYQGQMLSLKNKPSKMALTRAMNLRNYPEIEMEFDADIAGVAAEIIEKAGGSDVRRALEAAEVKTDAQESTSAVRNERKGDYMSSQFAGKESDVTKEKTKNKNQFAIIAGIGFFVVPTVFLAVALLSGYLKSLGGPGQQF
ncbi:hypothetical protein WJX77_010587 [Trebouxia sp. C0004]